MASCRHIIFQHRTFGHWLDSFAPQKCSRVFCVALLAFLRMSTCLQNLNHLHYSVLLSKFMPTKSLKHINGSVCRHLGPFFRFRVFFQVNLSRVCLRIPLNISKAASSLSRTSSLGAMKCLVS